MSKLSKSVMALVLAGAGAGAIATQFIGEKEGTQLTAYQDGAQIWTICKGQTKGVYKGMQITQEYCDAWFKSDIAIALKESESIVRAPMSEPRKAAVASFCAYNLGLKKCADSSFIRRLNAGDPKACEEISRWVFVGGKDCRIRSNNCYGIVERRAQERELCEFKTPVADSGGDGDTQP